MRIVVLTGYYHPNMYPPAACIDKYVHELKKKHIVNIVCQKSSYISMKYPDNQISIHYVSNWWNDLRNYATWNLDNKKAIFINRILLFFVRIYGFIISPICYPTRLSWLIDKYFSKLEEIYNNNGIDLVISVSNPVCTHLASLLFKRKHPKVKWVTYSTDPFTYYDTSYKNVINKSKRKKRNYKTEQSYYTHADINILTEELYDSTVNDFHIDKSKLLCFPYVLKKIISDTPIQNNDNQTTRVLYAGALNTIIRNPEFAISVLVNIPNIKIYLYQAGDCSLILSKYKSDNLIINNLVSRDEYLKKLEYEADILINIGNNSRLQAPSKMLELLSTGKPIINFYNLKNSQYLMIEKYPLGLNIGKDDNDPIEKVRNFCDSMKGKRLSYNDVEKLFPENNLRNQLRILESKLNI